MRPRSSQPSDGGGSQRYQWAVQRKAQVRGHRRGCVSAYTTLTNPLVPALSALAALDARGPELDGEGWVVIMRRGQVDPPGPQRSPNLHAQLGLAPWQRHPLCSLGDTKALDEDILDRVQGMPLVEEQGREGLGISVLLGRQPCDGIAIHIEFPLPRVLGRLPLVRRRFDAGDRLRSPGRRG